MNDERYEIFRALVGSHNYNLNTLESDKDFRIFTSPNFDDLYEYKKISKSIIGEKVDYHIHDIRKLPSLFYRGNLNFIEVLFSKEINVNEGILKQKNIYEKFTNIIYLREEIAKMNLENLFKCGIGMFKNKISNLKKGTQSTKVLIDKYGYDTKEALHSFRTLDFLQRYYKVDFKDFKSAIYYNDLEKQQLLDIKFGKYSLEEFNNIAKTKFETVKNLEKTYINYAKNEELYNNLNESIKDIIKYLIAIELK